jgi:predicted metalloprotease with PDZ domain
MWISGHRLGVGMGLALLALTALCPISHADEAEATGQGTSIGVTVQKLGDHLLERLSHRSGVLVTAVTPGGLADQVGIVKGDVLVVVGSVTLREPDDLVRAEGRIEPGQPVSVVISRDGGRLIKMLKLEPPPAPETTAAETPEPEPSATQEPSPAPATLIEAAPALPAPSTTAENAPAGGLARLGVRGEELNPDLAAALGVPRGRGMLVLQVKERSPAALAGIRAGDVITRVGEQRIWGVEHLESALAGASNATIMLRRQGAERSVQIQLDAGTPPSETLTASEEPAILPSTPPAAISQTNGEDASITQLREELRLLRRELRRLRDEVEWLKGGRERSY